MHDLRKKMVETQIQARGVTDVNVLKAMLKVQRHLFVDEPVRPLAYDDYPLSIGHGQTISQPYIVAYMTEALALKSQYKVLEIGTGSGYQAAIMAELAQEVYTIETIPELAKTAAERLSYLGYKNVHVRAGDGYQGWPQAAPFDAVMITAAPVEIPLSLVEQMKIGGKMIIPVGSYNQSLYLVTRTEKGIEKKELLPVRFVPMVKG